MKDWEEYSKMRANIWKDKTDKNKGGSMKSSIDTAKPKKLHNYPKQSLKTAMQFSPKSFNYSQI